MIYNTKMFLGNDENLKEGDYVTFCYKENHGVSFVEVRKVDDIKNGITENVFIYDGSTFSERCVYSYDSITLIVPKKVGIYGKLKKAITGKSTKIVKDTLSFEFRVDRDTQMKLNSKIFVLILKINTFEEIAMEFSHITLYTMEMLQELYGKISKEEYYCEIEKAREVLLEVYSVCLQVNKEQRSLENSTGGDIMLSIMEKHRSIMENNLLALRDFNNIKLLK